MAIEIKKNSFYVRDKDTNAMIPVGLAGSGVEGLVQEVGQLRDDIHLLSKEIDNAKSSIEEIKRQYIHKA